MGTLLWIWALIALISGSDGQLAQTPGDSALSLPSTNSGLFAPSNSASPGPGPGFSADTPFKVIIRVVANFSMHSFSRDGLDGDYCGHRASNITLLLNVGADALPGLTASGPWDDSTNHTISKDLRFPIYSPIDTGLQVALLLQSTGFDQMNYDMSLRFYFADGTSSAKLCFPDQSCGIEGKECVQCVCNFHPNYCILPYIYAYGKPSSQSQGDQCEPLPAITPPPLSAMGTINAPSPLPGLAPAPAPSMLLNYVYFAVLNISVAKSRASVPDNVFLNKFGAIGGMINYTDTINGGPLQKSVNLTGQNEAGFLLSVAPTDTVVVGYQLITSVTLDAVVNVAQQGASLLISAVGNGDVSTQIDPSIWPKFSANTTGIAGALLPNTCDGWVAADRVGPVLANKLTRNISTLSYIGSKSPSACGAVSNYTVTVEYGMCSTAAPLTDYTVCLRS